MSRAYGFLAEEPEQHDGLCGGPNRDARIGLDVGGAGALPKRGAGLVHALPPFKDQGNSLTCCAHGWATGAETTLAFKGIKVAPSSTRAMYTLSNELLRKNKNDRLSDEGTYLRVLGQATADFGVPPESAWPLLAADGSINDVRKEVPPDVLARASSWKLKEQLTVYEKRDARIRTVCTALAAGQALPCAGRVDSVFENYNGEGVIPAPNPTDDLGGHCVCIIDFETLADGSLEFLIVNSWKDWGFSLKILSGEMRYSLARVSAAWVMAQQEIYRLDISHGRNL